MSPTPDLTPAVAEAFEAGVVANLRGDELEVGHDAVRRVGQRNRERDAVAGGLNGCDLHSSVAFRTLKKSSPEKTMWIVLPSGLIHFAGKLQVSPGPTSHSLV